MLGLVPARHSFLRLWKESAGAHLSCTCHRRSWKSWKIFIRTAENTTGPTLKPFICILLHKEICYHKVITRRLAINMKSVQDNMIVAMLREKKRSGETEQEGHRRTRTERKWRKRTTTRALLDAAARQGREQMPSESFSAPLGVCVLSRLAGTESDRRRKRRFRCQVSSGLLAVLQSDLMKRRNVWSAAAPSRPAVSEGVNVSV